MFGFSKFISWHWSKCRLLISPRWLYTRECIGSRVSVLRAYVVGRINACNPADLTARIAFVSKSTLSFLCDLVGNRVMRSPSTSTVMSEITIRPASTPCEFRGCQEVQRRSWGIQEEAYLLPVATMVSVQHCGGLVLGRSWMTAAPLACLWRSGENGATDHAFTHS